jgi:hypothetical protein
MSRKNEVLNVLSKTFNFDVEERFVGIKEVNRKTASTNNSNDRQCWF